MQFDVNKWLRENMVEAVNKGYMSLPCISVKAGDYYKAGMFTAEDVEYIATNAKEPVVEVVEENTSPVIEPPMEVPTEETTEPAGDTSTGVEAQI